MAKSEHAPETFPALSGGHAPGLGGGEGSFHECPRRNSEISEFSESIKRGEAPGDFAVEGAAEMVESPT